MWVLQEDRRHGVCRGSAGEWTSPAQHLVQDAAHGEYVSTMIRRQPTQLLRRHVADGSNHHAGVGAALGRELRDPLAAQGHVCELRQPEVEDLHQSILGHHDVLGLQIPVHDPRFVCFRESCRGLCGEFQQPLDRKRTGVKDLSKRPSLDVLHRDEPNGLDLVDLVDRHDVRVIQGGSCAGFLFEALQPFGVGRNLSGKDLDRCVATEPGVAGAVNLTHPPGPDGLEDLVGAEACSCRQRHPANLPGNDATEGRLQLFPPDHQTNRRGGLAD
jgi:hypothetical protein